MVVNFDRNIHLKTWKNDSARARWFFSTPTAQHPQQLIMKYFNINH